MVVLRGVDNRLRQGAKSWAYPVSADAMGVAYRDFHKRYEGKAWFKSYDPQDRSGAGVTRCEASDLEELPMHIVANGGPGVTGQLTYIQESRKLAEEFWPTVKGWSKRDASNSMWRTRLGYIFSGLTGDAAIRLVLTLVILFNTFVAVAWLAEAVDQPLPIKDWLAQMRA